MDFKERVQVSVSRPIAAPAAKIFRLLADPANHPALDGSRLVRAAPGQPVPGRVGDTFTMAMHLPELDCTEADQSIRDAVQDGQRWVQAMHLTLERLAAIAE